MIDVQIIRILVDAGATPASAVRAASSLADGSSTFEALELVEFSCEPATFDVDLFTAEFARARERVLARSAS